MKRTDITALFPDATDEQINALMNLNGNDVNREKSKTEDVKRQLADAQAAIEALNQSAPDPDALEKATRRVADLEAELNGVRAAEKLRVLREAIAGETGVPASLLTGETEDDCKAQAEAILAFARPSAYPTVPDGGEIHMPAGSSTRDQFSDWLQEKLNN